MARTMNGTNGKFMINTAAKKRMGTIGFLLITLLLILISAFCMAGTVKSRTTFADAELEQYFKQKEKELVTEIRAYLNDSGFQNSGITLTRVIDEVGERTYTMTIHHGKIDAMTETDRLLLAAELADHGTKPEHCNLEYSFLLQ